MAASPEQSRSENSDRAFDPYYKWLGIPADEQPPHCYRLLALAPFEPDADVIEAAADRQMSYVKQCGAGPHSAASQKLLNELSAARVTLLDPAKKAAYDQSLRARLQAAKATPIPVARPAAAATAKKRAGPGIYAGVAACLLAIVAGLWATYDGGVGDKSHERAPAASDSATPAPNGVGDASQTVSAQSTAPMPKQAATSESVTSAETPAQSITIAEAYYGKPEANVDLTQRMQQAAQDGLLAVFVEPFLADGKFSGELYLRGQLGKQFFEQKFGHRQFAFFDVRPGSEPPKQGLVVLDAYYGAGIWGEGKMVDVKTLLSEQLENDRIEIAVKQLVAPIPDPAPGTSKVLILRYALDGDVQSAMFEEHQAVRLGTP